jgi:VIT1/CCC1 family predicted Fe2+/Mn2+ transporter
VSRDLLRPAIFGLADGCMSLLGVVLYLLHDQRLIFPAALMGGISAAVSMAGGEYLSDSGSGPGASLVMGLATGAGAVAPAVPFAFTTGAAALAAMVVISVATGVTVGVLRGKASARHGTAFEVAVTLATLAGIFGVVLACALVVPNPG